MSEPQRPPIGSSAELLDELQRLAVEARILVAPLMQDQPQDPKRREGLRLEQITADLQLLIDKYAAEQ